MRRKCSQCGGVMPTASFVATGLQKAINTPLDADVHYRLGYLQAAAVYAMAALQGRCSACATEDVQALSHRLEVPRT